MIFMMRRKKSCWFHVYLAFCLIFCFFILKEKYYKITLSRKRKCKLYWFICYLLDLLNVIYLLFTCFIQLLFRCYFSIDSSVDYEGFAVLRGLTFNIVCVALVPQQNWSDICRIHLISTELILCVFICLRVPYG